MWSSLGVTALFVLLLLIWWGVLHDNSNFSNPTTKASGPIGIICITGVFIALLWFHYN